MVRRGRETAITSGEATWSGRVGVYRFIEVTHRTNRSLPLHAHPLPSVMLAVAGEFEEQLDRRRFAGRAGDVVLKPPFVPHLNRYGEGTTPRFFLVECPIGKISQMAEPRIVRHPDVTRRMLVLRAAARARDPAAELIAGELISDLLARGPEEAADVEAVSRPGSGPSWLVRVHDRVCREYRDLPSLSELARDAGVHPDHLSRAFRRHFGFTISDLVRRRRVEHAASAIRTAKKPLNRVALEAGFSDQSHMTRQVRRYLGVTPGRLGSV